MLKRYSKSKLGNYSYEPLMFSCSNKVELEDRIKASYIGYVLNKVQEKKPENADVILNDGRKKTIKLNNDYHTPIVNELNELLSLDQKIPSVSLNKHCHLCPFEKNCLTTAEKEDSITLLGNMTSKVRKKYESKGIFTINQLSYLYKPRRRSRYWGEHKPRHQYELQALALRTQTIYTNELIQPPNENIELFIDIESLPEQGFHYLIGVLVSTPKAQQYHPFWANKPSEENRIWVNCIEIVNKYPNAPIFHYGSHEKDVFRGLANRYKTNVDNMLGRLCNLNVYIYGRIYFPTRTNSLKDICNYLGFIWTAKDASGLNSIVWRIQYEKTHKRDIRNKLVTYNKEDCTNLKKLKNIVSTICSNDSLTPNVKAANDQNQLLNSKGKQIVNDFTSLIKSAYGKYEQSKISLRKEKKRKKRQLSNVINAGRTSYQNQKSIN